MLGGLEVGFDGAADGGGEGAVFLVCTVDDGLLKPTGHGDGDRLLAVCLALAAGFALGLVSHWGIAFDVGE